MESRREGLPAKTVLAASDWGRGTDSVTGTWEAVMVAGIANIEGPR
jgi:hypothetical protein